MWSSMDDLKSISASFSMHLVQYRDCSYLHVSSSAWTKVDSSAFCCTKDATGTVSYCSC